MAWVEHRLGTFRVRLRLPDGTVVTDSSHLDRPTALIRATEIDVELARDRFLDPRDGQITLNDWVQLWQATHHAGPATWSAYHSHLRLHILPALGHLAPSRIRRQHVKALVNQLADRLAPRSTRDVLTVLSLVLNEAVDYRRIPHNPARGIRIPGRHPTERPHATPAQVAQIVARLPCRADQILVLTAAYTGLRWGELAGLQRTNLNLPNADLYVHPDTGALHEISGTLYLGSPKTRDSVRHVALPPFLVELLDEVCGSHPHDTIFCGARGHFQRRSNFARRAWRPALDGTPPNRDANRDNHSSNRTGGTAPIIAGMHFHDLRHTHKTWLIEDGIPEIAQARRLGHRLPGVRGIYSHATPAMDQAIIDALQHRWTATQHTTPPAPPTLSLVRDAA